MIHGYTVVTIVVMLIFGTLLFNRRESDARHQLESRAKKEIQSVCVTVTGAVTYDADLPHSPHRSYHQRTGQLLEENSRLKEDLKTLSNRNQCLLRVGSF